MPYIGLMNKTLLVLIKHLLELFIDLCLKKQ